MQASKNIVYGLIDPRTRLVRYVGKSTTGLARVKEHQRQYLSERTHKANWMRALKKLAAVRVFSDEARARMSAAHRGRKHTAETRARIGAAHRGKQIPVEMRARIAAALRGRPSPKRGVPMSDQQRAKISASRLALFARKKAQG